ncbi:LacI family DNA-binding transcriptional regulator [Zobellia sp. 1_MG-2023]|uniref:LacI family DNA-binding transcriptional regulator n=1 Tax=Zobellia sp. 1_MG-2023 TaxID=3062626 RepID=UPI0026E3D18E|nr:LacI family DNA-binding transcriptional regulator [Zobellia sp. 1_MG-2023]MDO6820972.1 LacI family DNA-binding transcriptional regulator [Zobellia sp. 1_MG-2023]
MAKKVTIYDLAQKLNISPATVSRSLNDHPAISQKTKDKVLMVAKETGYRTNKFAANLSKQKSNTIGVIVPKLNSNFMSTVLSGIEKIANDIGYNLIISQSLESEEKEKLNAKTLFDSGVDALLVSLAYETENFDHFTTYTDRKIPLLFFDRVCDLPNCPTISIDNHAAGFDATQHLIEQGCKNIVHISGNLKRNVYANRFDGYQRALYSNNIPFRKENLYESDLNIENVKDIISRIKNSEHKVDGIFVSNDTFAVHCIKELKKEGYSIPEEIKVVGFNNDPVSEVISPNLSTIEYPGYKMGILAGESIISHLSGSINIQSADQILIKHKLIKRESTKI